MQGHNAYKSLTRIRGPQPNGKSFSRKEQIRKHLPNSCMLHGKMQTLQQWAKNLCLYIANKDQCHCVTVKEGVQSVRVVEDLLLFLHAQHAAREHKAVIIKSSDTDVAVIAVSVQTDLPCSLYVFTGTGNRTRIIDITKVSSANKI